MMLQCGTHRKCLEAASDTDGVPVAGQRHGKGVQRAVGGRRHRKGRCKLLLTSQGSSRRHADAGVTKKSAGYLQQ